MPVVRRVAPVVPAPIPPVPVEVVDLLTPAEPEPIDFIDLLTPAPPAPVVEDDETQVIIDLLTQEGDNQPDQQDNQADDHPIEGIHVDPMTEPELPGVSQMLGELPDTQDIEQMSFNFDSQLLEQDGGGAQDDDDDDDDMFPLTQPDPAVRYTTPSPPPSPFECGQRFLEETEAEEAESSRNVSAVGTESPDVLSPTPSPRPQSPPPSPRLNGRRRLVRELRNRMRLGDWRRQRRTLLDRRIRTLRELDEDVVNRRHAAETRIRAACETWIALDDQHVVLADMIGEMRELRRQLALSDDDDDDDQ